MFLLPFVPRLDARHGGRTTAGVVARLAERHDAALVCLRAADEEGIDPVLRERCRVIEEASPRRAGGVPRRARRAWSLARGQPIQVADSWGRHLNRRVRALAEQWRPDVVHLELEAMARYLGALDGLPAARVLVATEAAGATALELHRAAHGPERLIRYLDMMAWRRFERAALVRVDAVVCYGERDRRALSAVSPGLRVETIPMRVELPERALDPLGSGRPSILFVGGFGHPPNIDAAVRLATCILPRVRARCPEALLYLVGDEPPKVVRALASDHTVVTGRVADVTPYLDRAAAVVAPLRLGGGMRVKVLEALAAGKAVVATRLAAEGVAEDADGHLLLAESDEELSDALTRLLEDPGARVTLAGRARTWAESTLDWDKTVAAYEDLYRLLVTPGAGHRRPR